MQDTKDEGKERSNRRTKEKKGAVVKEEERPDHLQDCVKFGKLRRTSRPTE